jgi:uncharacterized protein
MSLKVNLRHLDAQPVRLEGQLTVAELDIDIKDEVVRVERPVDYALVVEKLDGGLLVQGRLRVEFACQCVRCLRPFTLPLDLEDWTCHLPLHGEDQVKVVNDCVDLTPFVREDILLEFPQHPLCDPECRGLPRTGAGASAAGPGTPGPRGSPAWAELNKLKF